MASVLATMISAPFWYLASVVAFLASPAITLTTFFGGLAWRFISLPAHILSRFENIYIFCGSAAIVGFLVGTLFALVNGVVFQTFSLDSEATPAAARGKPRNGRQLDSNNKNGTPPENNAETPNDSIFSQTFGFEGDYSSSSSPSSSSPLMLRGAHLSPRQQKIFPILEEEDEFEDAKRSYSGQPKRHLARLARLAMATGNDIPVRRKKDI